MAPHIQWCYGLPRSSHHVPSLTCHLPSTDNAALVYRIRHVQKMEFIVSILAVANQSQYIFQYLQCWDATLSTGPCGPAKILSFRCPKGQILEKIARCARKSAILTVKNRDSALDNGKNEDPAKMTYSIPDFVSRNTINTQ